MLCVPGTQQIWSPHAQTLSPHPIGSQPGDQGLYLISMHRRASGEGDLMGVSRQAPIDLEMSTTTSFTSQSPPPSLSRSCSLLKARTGGLYPGLGAPALMRVRDYLLPDLGLPALCQAHQGAGNKSPLPPAQPLKNQTLTPAQQDQPCSLRPACWEPFSYPTT